MLVPRTWLDSGRYSIERTFATRWCERRVLRPRFALLQSSGYRARLVFESQGFAAL